MKLERKINKMLNKLSFFLRSDYAFGMPSELHIEPTNLCNLSCPLCPKGNDQMIRLIGNMSFEDFQKIVNEMSPALESILLWNYGEPFLNRDLFRMIRYARDLDISVKVSTNGQFLERTVSAILDSRLDRLNIALDGVTQETYEIYRVGGQVRNVIDGVRLLIAERKRRRLTYPITTLEFIVMKHNEHEIPQFEGLCGELDVDIVSLKTVNLYGNVHLADEFLPKNPSYSRYSDGRGIIWREGKSDGCARLYDSVMINWDGSVSSCCYDFNTDTYLGNVLKEGVKGVWNGKKFIDLRRRLFDGRDLPLLCQNCPGGYPNLWAYHKSLKEGIKPSF